MAIYGRKKRKIEVLAAGALGLFTVATLGVSSYAWFAVNRTASVEVQNIVAESSEFIRSVTYHHIYQTTTVDGVTNFSFNAGPTSELIIPTYSRATEDPRHQLLIEVELNSGLGDVVAKAYAKNNILEKGNAWSSIDWAENGNPLSSIVTIAYIPAENVRHEGEFLNITKVQGDSFITLSDDGTTPSYQQNLDLNGVIPNHDDHFSVYYVLDYNVDVIESIYSANIGNPVFESFEVTENGLKFACDFKIAMENA
ncbi:MAG: hypothetical protein MJ239_05910 [Bacilli bacterium]|nr:hypothetical protein [Bacilli bacterium]